MGMVVSVYSRTAFREFILPAINNADYQIVLRGKYFQLKQDVKLYFEVMSDEWRLCKRVEYTIKQAKKSERISTETTDLEKTTFGIHPKPAPSREGLELSHGLTIQLQTAYREDLTIIIKEVSSHLHPFAKYNLRKVQEISIGSADGNTIRFDAFGVISKHHATIRNEGSGFTIENHSSNGIYVNSQRIDKKVKLSFGDYINILGLHIVFLDDILAVDLIGSGARIEGKGLTPYADVEEGTVFLEETLGNPSETELYHRAPRNYERIGEGSVEIEAPPVPNKPKKQSIFMSIGPSITMALPMLLGCMMMIYAGTTSGGGTSLYMYSGLVMSVSSALVGVIWTLINNNQQKKQLKEEEEQRFKAYSEYLVEKTDEIKGYYDETTRRLQETYPEASVCFSFDTEKGTLWNRNTTHDDFLSHRVGLGERDFQYEIQIPKQQFSLYKDKLSEKPKFIFDNYKKLYSVPINIDLRETSLVGIIGGGSEDGAAQIARLLSLQIAANNCYTDVKLAYIYDKNSSRDFEKWGFAKWLPHTWSEDRKNRFVAEDTDGATDLLYQLSQVFRQRFEDKPEYSSEKIHLIPHYIVFISDPSILQGEAFSKYALEVGNEVGLTTILLAERAAELPNSCEFIIENSNQYQGIYHIYDGPEEKREVKFDSIDMDAMERFARRISSIRVPETEEGGELTSSLSFFDMIHVDKINQYPVAEMWMKTRTYENIRGQLGERAGGAPCYLDVHEKFHGPHGLVAGTTGSGKSETLQTYILSLAINYSPDDVGFFIIDYKGGGMANLFNGLPHMIGQISNLSGNQVKRAMISIKSENRRRQRIFTENGVNNINLYTKLYKNGEAKVPIPHLFIIIDEFAELKREEPDFMRELISVAQVGRSLGVHLILATQKPSGTVDDNIWSNSKFRICLRVQDQQDSKDMLHKSDAAYITQAGRGYLQVGNDELYELFQSGFSGAVYDDNMVATSRDIAKLISMTGHVEMTGNSVRLAGKKKSDEKWVLQLIDCLKRAIQSATDEGANELDDDEFAFRVLQEHMYEELWKEGVDYPKNAYNSDRLKNFVYLWVSARKMGSDRPIEEIITELSQSEGRRLPERKEKTQLDVTKEFLAQVARDNGYTHKHSLWLPLLGDHIYLNEFDEMNTDVYRGGKWSVGGEYQGLKAVVGRVDDPANQDQRPLIVDLSEVGHIAVIGTIVSGKSILMQTMLYSLICKYPADYVNLYAIDFSGRALSAFEQAPQIGDVMYEDDAEKIGKFFNMIGRIVEERKALFRGGNYAQYVQVNGVKAPSICVFIDNYASFKEKTESVYEDAIIALSKDGVGLGIYLVISGAGFGYNDISNRIGENIEMILPLNLPDRYAYGELLHTMQIEVTPESGIKGRGLVNCDGSVLEYQTALAVEAESDYQRIEQIDKICRDMNKHSGGVQARRVPVIPEKPVWTEFSALPRVRSLWASRLQIPVGYDMADAEVYGIPLSDVYCYLVYGGNRSGKSNFMRLLIQSTSAMESKICIIDTPNGEYKRYNDDDRFTYISDVDCLFNYFRDDLTPIFKERNATKNAMIAEDKEESEIYDVMSKEVPIFIFIADLSQFVNSIYSSEYDMKGFMETIMARGRLHNIFFFAELSVQRQNDVKGYKVFDTFVGYQTGIHFGGKVSADGFLPFEYMSYKDRDVSDPVGVASIPGYEDYKGTKKIIVPLANK